MKRGSPLVLLALILASGGAVCSREAMALRQVLQPAGKGTINLPYSPPGTDSFGNTWNIYQGGSVRQIGRAHV